MATATACHSGVTVSPKKWIWNPNVSVICAMKAGSATMSLASTYSISSLSGVSMKENRKSAHPNVPGMNAQMFCTHVGSMPSGIYAPMRKPMPVEMTAIRLESDACVLKKEHRNTVMSVELMLIYSRTTTISSRSTKS